MSTRDSNKQKRRMRILNATRRILVESGSDGLTTHALEERKRRLLAGTSLSKRGRVRFKDSKVLRDFEHPAQGGAGVRDAHY